MAHGAYLHSLDFLVTVHAHLYFSLNLLVSAAWLGLFMLIKPKFKGSNLLVQLLVNRSSCSLFRQQILDSANYMCLCSPKVEENLVRVFVLMLSDAGLISYIVSILLKRFVGTTTRTITRHAPVLLLVLYLGFLNS